MRVTAPDIDPGLASSIRLVSLDVDGVLTDGSIWFGASAGSPPFELRRFHALDGLAIRMLQEAGLLVAWVSGKRSSAVRQRATELGVAELSLGQRRGKLAAVRGMLATRGWTFGQAAHLGDDLPDLALLKRVGLPAAVANAVPEVRAGAAWTSTVQGGEGAVREFAEALLRARGEWDVLAERFANQDHALRQVSPVAP